MVDANTTDSENRFAGHAHMDQVMKELIEEGRNCIRENRRSLKLKLGMSFSMHKRRFLAKENHKVLIMPRPHRSREASMAIIGVSSPKKGKRKEGRAGVYSRSKNY